jgi:hypothetical protein
MAFLQVSVVKVRVGSMQVSALGCVCMRSAVKVFAAFPMGIPRPVSLFTPLFPLTASLVCMWAFDDSRASGCGSQHQVEKREGI